MHSFLKHRWTKEIINSFPCLEDYQKENVIRLTAHELGLAYGIATWVPERDLAFGFKLYSILHYCPNRIVEAARLSLFIEHFLLDHSLNTLVAATMQSIQPRGDGDIKDFDAINMWYERLDMRYNFSLGPTIFGLMTSDSLKQLALLEPPYLKDNNTFINEHDNMPTLLGKIY